VCHTSLSKSDKSADCRVGSFSASVSFCFFRFSTIRYSQGESGRGESTVEKRQQSRREHCRGESGDSAVKEIKLLRRERERGGSVELE
jgi:hypothetical protein